MRRWTLTRDGHVWRWLSAERCKKFAFHERRVTRGLCSVSVCSGWCAIFAAFWASVVGCCGKTGMRAVQCDLVQYRERRLVDLSRTPPTVAAKGDGPRAC